jgi:IS30 family transposase
MAYTQLTQEQRYQIHAFKQAGDNQTQIATKLGVHKSAVSRELKRNSGYRNYRPAQAQRFAQERQQAKRRPQIRSQTWQQVEALLRQQWSPEQISGRLQVEGQPSVSHERIYQYIYTDQRQGGQLYRHLRCCKQRRKRYGRNDRRGAIPGRVSIEERPAVVEAKSRLGDWEADTMIGQQHRQAIVSLTERKSKFTLLQKVPDKSAAAVTAAMLALLNPLQEQVHTITSDNGREFAHHQQIAKQLETDFYFAHAYASWERGLNENTNGLVRQYFPKHCDFRSVTDAAVDYAMQRLNHRPRKTLGFRTPHEVFYNLPVALLT